MAKDIKAIKCPNCGSVNKKEIRPDASQCQNCGTDYYLDSDDRHIYHHHEQLPPTHSAYPKTINRKLVVYPLIAGVVLLVTVYFGTTFFQSKNANTYQSSTAYKMPRSYTGSFVYMNTVSGDPVYLRLGTDYIDKGNDKSEIEVHAQFNNPLNGQLIADQVLDSENQRKDNCLLTFKTYAPQLILAIGCSDMLLQLDAKNNKLINVTKSMFKDFSELSSGVARLEFDFSKPMINIMNNEGTSYYYFPEKKKLIADAGEADKFWKKEFDRHSFEFGYLGDYFDDGKENQLIENKYDAKTGKLQRRDLTPGRKYFNPQILYQDGNNLLILVNSTAATNSPLIIQRIAVKTGKLEWALPPDNYEVLSATKCKQGFAIAYHHGDEADYAHGVLVIADNGKPVHNYKLSRLE